MSELRLQKILSTAGVSSRRAAERLIVEGRVSVNGRTATELGTKADPEHDDIRVDGRRIRPPARRLYILLNKPRGYITSRSDPHQRPTVLDLLREGGVREYVYPVGRLDYDSEGLLLLTSDGDLAARLTHPRHEVERTYEAYVAGTPDEQAIERLRRGIPLDGKRTMPAEVKLLSRAVLHKAAPHKAAPHKAAPHKAGLHKAVAGEKRTSDRRANGVLLITIREGRNRQVRRMCEAVGHPVRKLRRVRIGPITDRRLRVGEWRELTRQEVKKLKS